MLNVGMYDGSMVAVLLSGLHHPCHDSASRARSAYAYHILTLQTLRRRWYIKSYPAPLYRPQPVSSCRADLRLLCMLLLCKPVIMDV